MIQKSDPIGSTMPTEWLRLVQLLFQEMALPICLETNRLFQVNYRVKKMFLSL